MKLLITAIAFIALLATGKRSYAQAGQMKNPSNATLLPDTMTNAGTTYLAARLDGSGTLAIQLNVTKVSGTVGGTASLQASVDNAKSPAMWFAVPGTDTLTLADGNSVKSWSIPANYLNYRVRITTTGTQKSAPKAFYYLKNTFKN